MIGLFSLLTLSIAESAIGDGGYFDVLFFSSDKLTTNNTYSIYYIMLMLKVRGMIKDLM